MSVRRKTANRLTLFRTCYTCGRSIVTTADTPLVRQILIGGRQLTKYFCSEQCKQRSYKHLFDGKAEERRKERESSRDISAKNRRYYMAHREEECARARARYWADRDGALANNAYSKKKRRLLAEESEAAKV